MYGLASHCNSREAASLSRANCSACRRDACKQFSRAGTQIEMLCPTELSAWEGLQPLTVGLPPSWSLLGSWHNLEQL